MTELRDYKGIPAREWASSSDFLARARLRLKRNVRPAANGCWYWTGAVDGGGYGEITMAPFRGKVHRLAYLCYIGLIPADKVVDHRCHSESDCPGGKGDDCRRCINPEHLRLLSPKENIQAGRAGQPQRMRTACPWGHPYDEANTILVRTASGTGRTCRRCQSERPGRRHPRSSGVRGNRKPARAAIGVRSCLAL
jgi:hypothetical protein